jgi:hypothetical protein
LTGKNRVDLVLLPVSEILLPPASSGYFSIQTPWRSDRFSENPHIGREIARHTKPNARREKAGRRVHRVILKSRFEKLDTIDDVISEAIGVRRPTGRGS